MRVNNRFIVTKKQLIFLVALALTTFEAGAQSRHELRFVLGDMLSETVLYRDAPGRTYTGTVGSFTEDTGYGYTPHYGFTYTYKISSWFAAGVLLDCQNTWWTRKVYEGNDVPRSSSREHFYNLSLLPTLRFTYMEKNGWNLYSAFMAGLSVNGGSEKDYKGRSTLTGLGIGFTFFGAGYRWGNWGAVAELGMLSGLHDTNTLFMVGTRLLSAGVSYYF